MGYRDDFYIPDNIIGYSGSAALNPTVYFKYQCFFGRITQYYPEPDNLGRSLVRFAHDHCIVNYSRAITNQDILKRLHPNTIKFGNMFEFYNGAVTHCSRNAFVPIKNQNTMLRSHLSTAIHAFPTIKKLEVRKLVFLYFNSRNDYDYFISRAASEFGYKNLEDLKRDAENACEGEDLDVWLARYKARKNNPE